METQVNKDWNREHAAHTLRRIGFGSAPAQVQAALSSGRKATVRELMERNRPNKVLEKGLPGILAVEDIGSLASWWAARMLDDGAPFAERIALMWHNHFATSQSKVRDVRLMHDQVQLLRELGQGDFRKLLHAVARDPAMLLWLDGNENRLGNPNENFAREVLELFALGIGEYNETDIQEAARAFTGWGVQRRRFVFRENHHDKGTKEVLGKRAKFGGDEVLDWILESPACPRWIARRLLIEFVHPDPSAEEINVWGKVLVQQNWHIGKTCERLFLSDLFVSARAIRSRIASPIDIAIGTALTLDSRPIPRNVAEALSDMGQALYRPPSVKGWEGGRTWIHTGTWLARHNMLLKLAGQAVKNGLEWPFDRMAETLLPQNAPAILVDSARAAYGKGKRQDQINALGLLLTSPEAQLV